MRWCRYCGAAMSDEQADMATHSLVKHLPEHSALKAVYRLSFQVQWEIEKGLITYCERCVGHVLETYGVSAPTEAFSPDAMTRTMSEVANLIVTNGKPYKRSHLSEGTVESGPKVWIWVGYRWGQAMVEMNILGNVAVIIQRKTGYKMFHIYQNDRPERADKLAVELAEGLRVMFNPQWWTTTEDWAIIREAAVHADFDPVS